MNLPYPCDPGDADLLWQVIEQSDHDEDRLAAQLAALDRETLLALAAQALDARFAVRAPWDGPFVPSVGGCLSEDDTDDLADWVVGQGRAVWMELVEADDAGLVAAFERMYAQKRDAGFPGAWRPDASASVQGQIYQTYTDRFGDDFHEALHSFIDAAEAQDAGGPPDREQ
jgi:hypothetical protein